MTSAVAICGGLAGCGARTGLSEREGPSLDDAAIDDELDQDATPDTSLVEGSAPDDAAIDNAAIDDGAADDAPIQDATPDAPPVEDSPSDEGIPPIHLSPPVIPSECADAGAMLVYLLSNDSTLWSFYPPTALFTMIGPIACPATSGPNSMAVDHSGTAYVGFLSGEMFRVSTATAECEPTAFVPGQGGFPFTFGMGFSGNSDGGAEALYVAGGAAGGPASSLASIDTTTFSLEMVGEFNPAIDTPELTGTGAGDLFAFYAAGSGSAIGQIDKTNAEVTGQSMLPGVTQGTSYAFAIWGGDFYTFTAPAGETIVTRFRPSDGSIIQIATSPQTIVGAGVSTCSPQR